MQDCGEECTLSKRELSGDFGLFVPGGVPERFVWATGSRVPLMECAGTRASAELRRLRIVMMSAESTRVMTLCGAQCDAEEGRV